MRGTERRDGQRMEAREDRLVPALERRTLRAGVLVLVVAKTEEPVWIPALDQARRGRARATEVTGRGDGHGRAARSWSRRRRRGGSRGRGRRGGVLDDEIDGLGRAQFPAASAALASS